MEIRTIVSFKKICELNSFSKAAKALGYSQSTVTMQIKQLEKELEVNLFDRIGKNIRLTDEGRNFLQYANEIILLADNAREALSKDTAPKGELRIGLMESVCTSYLPSLLNRFHANYPEVRTVIRIGTFPELSDLLNTNTIDILWIFETPLEIAEWNKVYSYENNIFLLSSPVHKLPGTALKLKDIGEETFILTEKTCSYRTIFENKLNSLGFHPKIFLEIGNTEIIKKFTEADLGLSFLPEFTVREELKQEKLSCIPVSDFHLSMQGQLFIHKNKWITPGIQAFLHTLTESPL